jgi:hypothetical protein
MINLILPKAIARHEPSVQHASLVASRLYFSGGTAHPYVRQKSLIGGSSEKLEKVFCKSSMLNLKRLFLVSTSLQCPKIHFCCLKQGFLL